MDGETKPGVLYEHVWNYYQPLFEKIYRDDFPKRQKELDEMQTIVAGYDDLQSFVDEVILDPPEVIARDRSGGDTERMILSTIHSSKGLEWDAVFVMGLADGRFPSSSAGLGEQWEEERRLLYVAATRAKKYLYLSYPRVIMTMDRQFKRVGMSPFLSELRAGLFERLDSDGKRDTTPSFLTAQDFPTEGTDFTKHTRKAQKINLESDELQAGVSVTHPFFGEGVVVSDQQGRSLTVQFYRHGLKTLHLDYAKISILQ